MSATSWARPTCAHRGGEGLPECGDPAAVVATHPDYPGDHPRCVQHVGNLIPGCTTRSAVCAWLWYDDTNRPHVCQLQPRHQGLHSRTDGTMPTTTTKRSR